MGRSWGSLVAIVNDGDKAFLEPNAVWDDHTKTAMIQYWFGECDIVPAPGSVADKNYTGPRCPPPYTENRDCCKGKLHHGHKGPATFQINSTDMGLTWDTPVCLDDMLGLKGALMGPGNGSTWAALPLHLILCTMFHYVDHSYASE